MVQAALFGTAPFSETDHAWALNLGASLADWMFSQAMSSDSEVALERTARINELLKFHDLPLSLPKTCPKGKDGTPDQLKLEQHVNKAFHLVHVIGVERYTGLYGMLSYASRMCSLALVNEQLSPVVQEFCSSVATSQLQEMGTKYEKLFPSGFRIEAIIDTLLLTKGSTSELRKLLLAAQKPMIILVALSDAPDQDALALLEEARQMKLRIKNGALGHAFDVQIQENPRATELIDQLRLLKPTFVHFSGHGSKYGLRLCDDQGVSVDVPPPRLAKLLRGSAVKDGLRAIFMNACYSASQAEALRIVPCDLVLMEGSPKDKAAVSYSAAFYAAMASGSDVKDAVERANDSYNLLGSFPDLEAQYMAPDRPAVPAGSVNTVGVKRKIENAY